MADNKEALKQGSDDQSEESKQDDSKKDESKHTLEEDVGQETPGDKSQSQKQQGSGKSKSGDDEETTTISKSELEQLKEDRENYRKGLISERRKNKTLPKSSSKEPSGKGEEDTGGKSDDSGSDSGEDKQKVDTSQFVTKEELQKHNEEQALALADNDPQMPYLNEHWDEIVAKFDTETSRDSVTGILKGIRSAYDKWGKENPTKASKKTAKSDETKKSKAEASTDTSHSKSGSDKSADQRSTKKKEGRSILPDKKSMDDWY